MLYPFSVISLLHHIFYTRNLLSVQSVFGHPRWLVHLPKRSRLRPLIIHLVNFRRHQVVEVRWEFLHRGLVPLLGSKLERPTTIHFEHQMVAFRVIDTKGLPACDNLIFELGGLLARLDATLAFEVAADGDILEKKQG